MEFGRVKNFIGIEWVNSESTEILQVRNPALDEVIGEVPMSTEAEVQQTVQAAKEAFPEWREAPPLARVRYLFRIKGVVRGKFRRTEPSSDQGARKDNR